MLKAHDIYVILKVLSLDREHWTYKSLETQLRMSRSEANAAVKRAIASGLMRPALGTESNPQPIAAALIEFLEHGIRFVFPARTGGLVRGVPTGFAAPGLENLILNTEEPVPVWPYAEGSFRGYCLAPLHGSAPAAIQDEPRFHMYLALADLLRMPSPRSREVAASKLRALIGSDA